MKRIPVLVGGVVLLSFMGCAPKTEPAAEPTPAAKVEAAPSVSAPASNEVLSMNYMNAASALAVDDFDKAKASLTELAKESTGELHEKAQAAADTGQIAAMRESFKALSEVAAKMKLPAEYSVAFCPMYKSGSKWVQKKDTLANPYFGKSMQTCGSFVNQSTN